ncbi:hypothetical protein AH4AK4_2267 [Aeromonas hydrophila 4AK4]|nr:hypothetical protein AH4AK4_2267 [Aeromonas hydrophila 4AK4]
MLYTHTVVLSHASDKAFVIKNVSRLTGFFINHLNLNTIYIDGEAGVF